MNAHSDREAALKSEQRGTPYQPVLEPPGAYYRSIAAQDTVRAVVAKSGQYRPWVERDSVNLQ